MIAFAVGVWQSGGPTRALRIVAGLLIAYAVITLAVGHQCLRLHVVDCRAGRRAVEEAGRVYFSGNNDRQLTSASDRGFADSSSRNRRPSDDGMKS